MSEPFKSRIWISSRDQPSFPELSPPYRERLESRRSIALCFSGGGTRALTAAMGQYRALHHLGAIDKARYISSVSGGTWASSLFTFYRSGGGRPQDDAEFLGPITPPEKITSEGLRDLPRTRLGYVATLSLRNAILELAHKVPEDRLWIEAVGRTYLENFGLYDRDDPAYFSLDEETVREIQRANPELGDARFHTVRREGHRPFLVMNSCLVGPEAGAPFKDEELVHFEYSPLGVGSAHPMTVRFTSKDGQKHEREVGGGFVQPFAFGGESSPEAPADCQPPEPPSACTLAGLPRPPRRWSLADSAGTSSAAPSAIFDRHGITRDLGPQAIYWPVRRRAAPPAALFDYGDGGNLENFGLITMLQRKVKRLVVFINTSRKLSLSYDPSRPPTKKDVTSDLPPLFGFPTGVMIHNQVFHRADFKRLIEKLQAAKRAGGPTMATTAFEVLPQPWWGVEGGWTAHILWFYLDRVRDWERRLPWRLRTLIKLGNNPIFPLGPYRHFPNYSTIDENFLDLVELTRRQVNLMADLTCWSLTENGEMIERFLDPDPEPAD